jgi:2-methylisocitrate lyase-like PEP mutase family enzyme
MTSSPGARLKQALAERDIVVAPGAADGLAARLIEDAGFPAVYCTGGGISRGRGFPDLGLVTLTEAVERVSNMTEICSLPMIADVDAGFGNVLTLQRAVRLLERAGAAGLHVEDKEVPHRSREAKNNIVGMDEMCGRVRAAVAARRDPDFMIVARTDCLPTHGMEEAIRRGRAYAAAGADMIYVEHFKTKEQIERVARELAAPKLVSLNKGENELVPAAELGRMGYTLLTLPAELQLASIHAMRAMLDHISRFGTSDGFDAMATFPERSKLVNTDAYAGVERLYLP